MCFSLLSVFLPARSTRVQLRGKENTFCIRIFAPLYFMAEASAQTKAQKVILKVRTLICLIGISQFVLYFSLIVYAELFVLLTVFSRSEYRCTPSLEENGFCIRIRRARVSLTRFSAGCRLRRRTKRKSIYNIMRI